MGQNTFFWFRNYFVLFILLIIEKLNAELKQLFFIQFILLIIKKLNAELKQLFFIQCSRFPFEKVTVCPVLFMVNGLAATLLTHDFKMTSYCDVIMSKLSQYDVILTLFGSWTVAVNYLPFLVYSRRKK